MSGLDQPIEPAIPETPVPPGAPPPAPARRSRGRLWVALAGVGAVLGALAVKFVLPLVLVGVAGSVLDVAFGGPYMRLPSDVRAGFEQRLESALGSSFRDQTEEQQTARVTQLVKAGLPRLGDELVDANFRLASKGLQAVDEASCATIGRAIIAGREAPDDASTALINTFSDADLRQWFEIRISALEAEVRGSPDVIAITDDAVSPLYDKLFVLMSQDDITTIGEAGDGGTVEDAPLCAAVRGLYSAVLSLPADEVLLFARYDVSP